jgi:hypothetical protein
MYLVDHPPWQHRVTTVASEGPPVVVVGLDAGVGKPKKPKKRSRPVANQPAPQAGDGEDEVLEPPPPPLTAADRALEWRGDDVALPTRPSTAGPAASRTASCKPRPALICAGRSR